MNNGASFSAKFSCSTGTEDVAGGQIDNSVVVVQVKRRDRLLYALENAHYMSYANANRLMEYYQLYALYPLHY
jgi:hypothetical protein